MIWLAIIAIAYIPLLLVGWCCLAINKRDDENDE